MRRQHLGTLQTKSSRLGSDSYYVSKSSLDSRIRPYTYLPSPPPSLAIHRFHNPPKRTPELMLSCPAHPSVRRTISRNRPPCSHTTSVRVVSRTHGGRATAAARADAVRLHMASGMIGYGNWWGSIGLAGEVGVVVFITGPCPGGVGSLSRTWY